MSGSVELSIDTGADWNTQLEWLDGTGTPIDFLNPVMDIRQDYSPVGTVIARLDTSGTLDGTITFTSPGVVLLSLPSEVTSVMQAGRGFWDIFVDINGVRVRLAFGTVDIQTHVTVSA